MAKILPAYKAYDRLKRDNEARLKTLEQNLDELLDKTKKVESKLLKKFKLIIALSLKWKFDFYCKTLESPFEIENDVRCWIEMIDILKILGEQNWFELSTQTKGVDPWKRTADGFDVGWTTTTAGEQFEISKQIAKDRLDQIMHMLGGTHYFDNKEILDSGCGPGRYGDLLRKMNIKRIVLLDQGARLIDVLNTRFKNDPKVTIVKGTCEKIEFPAESFDFVLSNGVLHHTSADLLTMIKDHARVLRKGGAMFVMLIGKGGLEMKMWEFLRNFLYDINIEEMIDNLKGCISPLRLQGVVDHMYGEYQQTEREVFEKWCSGIFTRVERVPGIAGLDVTPELYKDDPYFDVRFGCGQLRYICHK